MSRLITMAEAASIGFESSSHCRGALAYVVRRFALSGIKTKFQIDQLARWTRAAVTQITMEFNHVSDETAIRFVDSHPGSVDEARAIVRGLEHVSDEELLFMLGIIL